MSKKLGLEHKRRKQREWVARRREDWLEKHGPCVKCGSRDRLEVDHIDPKQKVNHRVFSWSKGHMEAELAKCQALCYTCHKAKSAVEMGTVHKRPVNHIHGTTTEYRRGCRCELCKAAKIEAGRSYRAAQPNKYTRQRLLAA